MRKLMIVLVLLLFLSAALSGAASGYLSDLTGHWSASLITALEARGIVSGDERGRFTPDSPLTRAQMAKLFTVGLGYESDAEMLKKYSSRYTDVPFWHWGRGYIESFTELGIAEGYGDGRFAPDEPVTRAQLAVLAVRSVNLSDRARLARAERTPYKDDADIPSWARGAVFVAQQEGLLTGTPEGYFYPDRAVTRAEGSAIVFRLLNRKGALFHLEGTLVRYNPETRTGTVRDMLGQESSFVMEEDATYMQQGVVTFPEQVRDLDQVFVILDEAGHGKFLEARYQDLLVETVTYENGGLNITHSSGEREFRLFQPGALVFLNGRPSRVEEVSGANPVYLVLDSATGEVRLVDAVRAPIQGLFGGVTDDGQTVRILLEQQEHKYPLAPAPIIIVDGEKTDLTALVSGDEIRVALDEAGRLAYMEVTR